MDKKFVYFQNKKICINTVNPWDAEKKKKNKEITGTCRTQTDELFFMILEKRKLSKTKQKKKPRGE